VAINDGNVPFIGGIRSILRFFGSGVTVRDDKPNNKINIEITGGGGGGGSFSENRLVFTKDTPVGPLDIPLSGQFTPSRMHIRYEEDPFVPGKSDLVLPSDLPFVKTFSGGGGTSIVVRFNSVGVGVIHADVTSNNLQIINPGRNAVGHIEFEGLTGSNLREQPPWEPLRLRLGDGVVGHPAYYEFEFDTDGSVLPGNIPIPITVGMNATQLVAATISAINGVSNLDVTAATSEGGDWGTALLNDHQSSAGNIPLIWPGGEESMGFPGSWGGMQDGVDPSSVDMSVHALIVSLSEVGGGGGGFELAANGEVDAAKACNAADSRLGGGGGGFELAADGEVDATKACNAADSRLVGISPSRGRRTWTGSIELPASTLTGDYPMLQSESPYFRPRRIEMFAYDPNDPTQFSHGVALVTMPIGQEEATGQFAMRNSCHLQDRMSVNELGLEIGIDESMHGDGWRGTARYSLDDGFVLHLIKFGNGRDLYIKVFAEG
jgi:hypothetical protein